MRDRPRLTRIVHRTALAAFVVLALTGMWLTRYYRPNVQRIAVWGDLPSGIENSLRWARVVRGVHNAAALVFVIATVAGIVLLLRSAWPMIRRAAVASAWVIGVVAGSLSGIALAWDQLALRAIGGNTNFNGTWPAAFSEQIRFVIVDNARVTQSSYRTMLLVHLFAVPAWLVLWSLLVARQPKSAKERSEAE